MINKQLINEEVQEYITQNLYSDLSKLRFRKSPFNHISSLELVQQIQGKKIAQKK